MLNCCGESAADLHRAVRLHVALAAACGVLQMRCAGLRSHLQQLLPGKQPAECKLKGLVMS